MKTKLLIISIAVLCLSAAPAKAALFGGGGGATLQGALDGITLGPNPGVSSVNVVTDDITDTLDSYWNITGTGGSVSTIIIELAAFSGTNTFGMYDASNSANIVQIFGGGAGSGAQAVVGIQADGSVFLNYVDTGVDFASGNKFGFYLDATTGNLGAGNIPPGTTAVFYSDTSLNLDAPGGIDHMYAYQGKNVDMIQILPWSPGLWTDNEFALAWEDIWGGGDLDFDDFVVMVESVVPVPGAVLLGILGLGVAGWKLRKYA